MHPVLELALNTLFGVLCAGAGDAAMQYGQLRFARVRKPLPEQHDEADSPDFCAEWDVPRTVRYSIVPGALHGFVGAAWTVFLLPAASGTGEFVTFPEALKKSIIDVLALTCFLVPLDFLLNGMLNKKTCEQIGQKFKDDYPQACLFSVVWFPVDVVVFMYVPLHYQPATNKILDLLYFLFLSLPINQAKAVNSLEMEGPEEAAAKLWDDDDKARHRKGHPTSPADVPP
eukprot:EG_transcript_24933